MGRWGRSRARKVVVIAQRERETRLLGLSPMTPHRGRAAEMLIRWCSIEATGGAPMGRWFRERGGEIGVGVGVMDNVGCSHRAFYMVVGRRKTGGLGEGGSGGGTSMAPVIGDGNGEFEVMRCGHFLEGKTGRRQGGSTVSEANDTVKSGAKPGEAEGCGWRLEVEDDQRKFGWWAKYAVGPNC
jgi:hypothetical protein